MEVSDKLVASIAFALNSAEIPCILWGQYLLNLHGISVEVNSVDFVVSTWLLTEASKALDKVSYLGSCTKDDSCPWSPKKRKAEEPPCHWHIKDSSVTVGIYPHARILWFLPETGPRMTLEDQQVYLLPKLCLASSSTQLPKRRGDAKIGSTEQVEYPVIIPKLSLLMDTFMRLHIRDKKAREGAYAGDMIRLLAQWIDNPAHPGSGGISDGIKRYYRPYL